MLTPPSSPTSRRTCVRSVQRTGRGGAARWLGGAGAAIALATGCATSSSSQYERDLAVLQEELEAQRRAQTSLRARLERLEQRQRTLEAMRQGESAGQPSGFVGDAHVGPPHSLPVVRLQPRSNPVMEAPPIPTRIPLRDPSPDDLARFGEPAVDLSAITDANNPDADLAFSLALQKYNMGNRREAGADLRQFAVRFPRHAAADNALYLAGMALVSEGRCNEARSEFERVEREYPKGDAVASALLAMGQCEAAMGRVDSARTVLNRVVREHAKSFEASQAKSALNDLPVGNAPVDALPVAPTEATERATGFTRPVRG